MLSAPRLSASRISRPLSRLYSEIVPVQQRSLNRPIPSSSKPAASESTKASKVSTKVLVREDHGLYAFFRMKPDSGLTGEERYEVFETPDSGRVLTGRPWKAEELRNKSFKDLHTLWYVALRERNLLATQKEETRRMGVTSVEMQVPLEKVRRCRKTMARIKQVLNERRLAYEGARKLAETEREAHEYAQIQSFLSSEAAVELEEPTTEDLPQGQTSPEGSLEAKSS